MYPDFKSLPTISKTSGYTGTRYFEKHVSMVCCQGGEDFSRGVFDKYKTEHT